ncbi:MAG: hypothetical protein ACRDG4_19650 [Chloroflexota bacterium]
MKRLVRRLLLLLFAKLARRQAWKLVRGTVGKQIRRWGGKQARALPRRLAARAVRLSAVALGKSPLRNTDAGERVIVRLFTLEEQLHQD